RQQRTKNTKVNTPAQSEVHTKRFIGRFPLLCRILRHSINSPRLSRAGQTADNSPWNAQIIAVDAESEHTFALHHRYHRPTLNLLARSAAARAGSSIRKERHAPRHDVAATPRLRRT